MEDKTLLNKHILPPKEMNFCFQRDSFDLSFLKTISQWEDFLGFPPTNRPKYTNGSFITLQCNSAAKLRFTLSSTHTPAILLLKKFTLRPEESSKQRNIHLIERTLLIEASPMKIVSSANCNRE